MKGNDFFFNRAYLNVTSLPLRGNLNSVPIHFTGQQKNNDNGFDMVLYDEQVFSKLLHNQG